MEKTTTEVNSRRHRANVENSRVSTGPRSHGGKVRSSKNSFKHGLSASTRMVSSEDALAWGKKIAASLADDRDEVIRWATEVASAQLQLTHVRNLRYLLAINNDAGRDGAQLDLQGYTECKIAEVLRLDRYERRAISRRKKAVFRLRDALR